MVDTVRVFVGLGSNMGDRRATIDAAVASLSAIDGVEVIRVSDMLENDAVGGPPGQGPFLNAVAELRTELAPRDLLAQTQRIENELGRTRTVRWGPRTIDIDILMYGDLRMRTDELTIPHPEMTQRAFVLGPMAQIAPDAVHPASGCTIARLADRLCRSDASTDG